MDQDATRGASSTITWDKVDHTSLSAEELAIALNMVLVGERATIDGTSREPGNISNVAAERSTRHGARKSVSWAAYVNVRVIPPRSSKASSRQAEDVCVAAVAPPEAKITAEQRAALWEIMLSKTRRVPKWAGSQ